MIKGLENDRSYRTNRILGICSNRHYSPAFKSGFCSIKRNGTMSTEKRYFIIQETAYGSRPLPYTESGFSTRHKARHYLEKSGQSYCRIVGKIWR